MSTELKIKKAEKALSEDDLKKIGGGNPTDPTGCVNNDTGKKNCDSD